MTRFFVNLSVKDALEELKSMLDKLTLSWKSSAFSIVSFIQNFLIFYVQQNKYMFRT